jgi:hypothetical protein
MSQLETEWPKKGNNLLVYSHGSSLEEKIMKFLTALYRIYLITPTLFPYLKCGSLL